MVVASTQFGGKFAAGIDSGVIAEVLGGRVALVDAVRIEIEFAADCIDVFEGDDDDADADDRS